MAFQYAEAGTGESLYRRGCVTLVLLPVGKSQNPEDDQVIDGFLLYKQDPSKKTCGSELHHRYTDQKKASIVSEQREIQSRRNEVISKDDHQHQQHQQVSKGGSAACEQDLGPGGGPCDGEDEMEEVVRGCRGGMLSPFPVASQREAKVTVDVGLV